MMGDYDDEEFMEELHKKGQVFFKQEYHRVMPFCLRGDASSLELLLTLLEDYWRVGSDREKPQRVTVLNLLLYWARQGYHLLVTRQEGRPDLIKRLLMRLLDII